jgi:hypothetical protein
MYEPHQHRGGGGSGRWNGPHLVATGGGRTSSSTCVSGVTAQTQPRHQPHLHRRQQQPYHYAHAQHSQQQQQQQQQERRPGLTGDRQHQTAGAATGGHPPPPSQQQQQPQVQPSLLRCHSCHDALQSQMWLPNCCKRYPMCDSKLWRRI